MARVGRKLFGADAFEARHHDRAVAAEILAHHDEALPLKMVEQTPDASGRTGAIGTC